MRAGVLTSKIRSTSSPDRGGRQHAVADQIVERLVPVDDLVAAIGLDQALKRLERKIELRGWSASAVAGADASA